MISVTLPIRTVSTLNEREHWRKRAARAAEHRALARMLCTGPVRAARLALPVRVTLTRVAPRALDGANLQASLKNVRDGIADALGVDDRTSQVTWAYRQRRGAVRECGVEISVETI